MSTPSSKTSSTITWFILGALVVGGAVGQWLHGFNVPGNVDSVATYNTTLEYLHFIGNDIFLGLLKMLIVPLIISSVIVGIASVGDFRKLGRIGLKTFTYYITTMLIAVTIGLILVSIIQPGNGMDITMRMQGEQSFTINTGVQERIDVGPKGFGPAMLQVIKTMIPTNPIAAAADPKIAALPIIFFSIFFGIMLTTIGDKKKPIVGFMDGVFEVMTKMVHVVLWLAPIGVFALSAWSVAGIGLEVFFTKIGVYMITVLGGLLIHGGMVLPLVLWIVGRVNPFQFMYQMRSALMMAFGTDSSSATLPVTIDAAIEEGGCSKKAAGFVLPLGATINMDGTALYEAVAVAFIAQAYSVSLGWEQGIIIALVATLTAVGAAGIPSGSIVLIPVVIAAVNQSLTGSAEAAVIPVAGMGLILGVDRLLDMSRTTVNVWGDAVGAKIISRTEKDDDTVPGPV